VLLAALAFTAGLGVGATLAPIAVNSSSAAGPPVATQMPTPPETPSSRATLPTATHPAEVLRVLDGDTFEARIHLWPGLDITTRVRLRNIDAPELKARCADERIKAEIARDALRTVLDRGEVGISRVTLDKYGGRVVADASAANTPHVGAELIAAGLARRYSGGRRESWCP
jgi:endonuclease YncB( thermonuclease family)